MKIRYKILWFEDQFDEISATVEAVEDMLGDFGFSADIERVEVVTHEEVTRIASNLSGYNPYDLILFDYQLGGSGYSNGVDIANSLRQELFSDMIFYSATPRAELRKLLYDQNIEGVFTAGRFSFSEDVEPIIEDQIKRISDVNMMRGIVMDEVSRFDRLLRELCVKYLEEHDELREDAKLSLARRFKKQGKTLEKRAESKKCPTAQYVNVRLTTFDLVKRGLMECLERKGETELQQSLGENGLLHRLQKLRNRLAHVEGRLDESGVMTLLDDETESFDFEKFIQIRKDLRIANETIANAYHFNDH